MHLRGVHEATLRRFMGLLQTAGVGRATKGQLQSESHYRGAASKGIF